MVAFTAHSKKQTKPLRYNLVFVANDFTSMKHEKIITLLWKQISTHLKLFESVFEWTFQQYSLHIAAVTNRQLHPRNK
jgi:hypothetical protein